MKAVIVTGLSGAGKTQAIDCLEDMGYYCIDNMPPALIKSFIDLTGKGKGIDKAAFVIDVRGGRLFDDLKDSLDELQKDDIDYKILYLEASDRVLLRRYNESRRQHPLSEGGPVAAGLKLERERLEVLRKEADYVIDTSNMKTAQLWAEIKHMLTSGENQKTFIINIMSFGYKRGTPMAADMVFDMRFIPNPYYVKSLRPLTGNNAKVKQVRSQAQGHERFSRQGDGHDRNAVAFLYQGGKIQPERMHRVYRRSSQICSGRQRAAPQIAGKRKKDDAGAQRSVGNSGSL